jgi:hypothetical protein
MWGSRLDPVSRTIIENACALQSEAAESIRNRKLDQYMEQMTSTLNMYLSLPEKIEETRFFDDMEGPYPGWNHGGIQDE